MAASGGISAGNTHHRHELIRQEDVIARATHLMSRGILQELGASAHAGISHHASVVQPSSANILENHGEMAEPIGVTFGEDLG